MLIQEAQGGAQHLRGCQTSPGVSKFQPGLSTPAIVDLVGGPAAPCVDAEQAGRTERLQTPSGEARDP